MWKLLEYICVNVIRMVSSTRNGHLIGIIPKKSGKKFTLRKVKVYC